SGCQSRLQRAKSPSTRHLFERDAGRSGFASVARPFSPPTSALPKSPSASSPLGGCPASCPDTYRLTHDHRHVRNWASPHISVLTLLRKNFFRLRAELPNICLRCVARATLQTLKMNER